MAYIPTPVVADIIRRVGKQGFRHLGPFIAARPAYKELVYSDEVLSEADLDEFIFNGHLANVSSSYRPFLMKYLEKGHPKAKYVESLRILTQVGPSEAVLDMLGETATESIYAHFAYAMMLIMCGALEDGLMLTKAFFRKVPNIHDTVMIADQVETQIREMGILGYRIFDGYYHFEIAPLCWLEHHNGLDICEHCFAFTYRIRRGTQSA